MNNTKQSYELKALSRKQLIGKYGIAISALLTVAATVFLCNSVLPILYSFVPSALPWINILISIFFSLLLSVFTIGEAKLFLNIVTYTPVRSQDIFYGYGNYFGKSMSIGAIQLLIFYSTISLPSYLIREGLSNSPTNSTYLLLTALGLVGIITYTVLSLLFSQARFLLVDLPNLKTMDIFRYSIRIMKSNKGKLLYIWISFIPLLLISLLSFGIALLWIIPYIQATLANFYLDYMRSNS